MVEIVNRPYAKAFEDLRHRPSRSPLPSAESDLSCEVDGFRDRHPDQFLSLGMAEQNMLSFAGGLAMQGYRPFIHTFSVFLYRRPYDQLIKSIAYSNRKVRLMGFFARHHHAGRYHPPGDRGYRGAARRAEHDHPRNRRCHRGRDRARRRRRHRRSRLCAHPAWRSSRLFSTPFEFNRAAHAFASDDILVVSSGVCTEEALRATQALTARGIGIHHLHASTLKPFDRDNLTKAARGKKGSSRWKTTPSSAASVRWWRKSSRRRGWASA